MKDDTNNVRLIGNLGADPKVVYNDKGLATATMSIAVTVKWEDKNGEIKERTDWIPLVCYGKVAVSVEESLKKGMKVEVKGQLSTNSWTDKEGNKKSKMQVKVLEYEIKNTARRDGDNDMSRM